MVPTCCIQQLGVGTSSLNKFVSERNTKHWFVLWCAKPWDSSVQAKTVAFVLLLVATYQRW